MDDQLFPSPCEFSSESQRANNVVVGKHKITIVCDKSCQVNTGNVQLVIVNRLLEVSRIKIDTKKQQTPKRINSIKMF